MPTSWLESSFIWTAALGLTALIVLFYFLAFVLRGRRDKERFEEAVRLGIDRPAAQYPFVDPERCIGCGTCVKACPEGDILGVVGGTAVVVNGLRCVGHAHCETACPVDAIQVGLGPIRDREDVPILDPHHEASVPGVFVVGELGGLSLIKNAVTEGREAIHRIAQQISQDPAADSRQNGSSQKARQRVVTAPHPRQTEVDRVVAAPVDVAIVGAGPAGIAAALAAVEAGLSYVVLEQEDSLGGTLLHYPRRKLVLAQPFDLPLYGSLKKEEYRKEELLEIFAEAVARFRLDIRFTQKVRDVEREGEGFRIRGTSETYASRFLVLALGRRGTPRRLGVPGEELPKVLYQLRDAESYRDRQILCVGGGDSAVEAAMGLARQPGNRVTLSYRRERLVRIKKKNQVAVDKMLRRDRLRAAFGSQVLRIEPDHVVMEMDGEQKRLPNDDVFIFIGGEPSLPLLKKLHLQFGGSDTAPE